MVFSPEMFLGILGGGAGGGELVHISKTKRSGGRGDRQYMDFNV